MNRHPFANPEHLYGYGRPHSYSLDLHSGRRSPAPGPYGPYAYKSFVPMASQSSFFVEPQETARPTAERRPARGRSASLPERRPPPFNRYVGDVVATFGEDMEDEILSEPAQRGSSSSWKRAFHRIRRQARRGFKKVRALLHRDERRSVSGHS